MATSCVTESCVIFVQFVQNPSSVTGEIAYLLHFPLMHTQLSRICLLRRPPICLAIRQITDREIHGLDFDNLVVYNVG